MSWLQKIALPVDSDWLGNLHDEELRNAAPRGTRVLVYHGTSSKRLALIFASGFLDPNLTPDLKSYEDSSNGVFVTTSIVGAEMYAYHSSQDEDTGNRWQGHRGGQGDEVILELDIPWDWIKSDPDDIRHGLKGQPNQATFIQGRIVQPVDIKRIRRVRFSNETLAEIIPGPEEITAFPRTDDKKPKPYKTEWIPIGKAIDVIQKLVNKGADLPPEYYQMVSPVRPRGLSRSKSYEDQEVQLAEKLLGVLHTFVAPGTVGDRSSYDATLLWIYQNKNRFYSRASEVMPDYFENMEPGSWQLVTDAGSDYIPFENESVYSYIQRRR